MERKIGETFEYKDIVLKCVSGSCIGCYFNKIVGCCSKAKEDNEDIAGNCTSRVRKDSRDVQFIEVRQRDKRNIILTLEKAKEWYNSGSEELKEIALQAYTEDELNEEEFRNIKTFEDACDALGILITQLCIDFDNIDGFENDYKEHLKAVYKLDIIRKALNKDWKPGLVEDKVYYPFVRFYPAGKDVKEVAANNNWSLGPTFVADSKKYTLVSGGPSLLRWSD